MLAIICARGGSKRLPNKNIRLYAGVPSLARVIRAAKNAKYVSSICVDSDDTLILDLARNEGVRVQNREKHLADDDTPRILALRAAVESYQEASGATINEDDYICCLQANSPEITANNIDDCIRFARQNALNEVATVGLDFIQNAAIRIVRKRSLWAPYWSTHFGIVVVDVLDVHELEDALLVDSRLKERLTRTS